MAIDLCNASPRISFSHDLCPTDLASVGLPRQDSLIMESDDFDFCVADSFEHDSFASCADELFSDGKILPQEIKKQQILPPKPPTRHNSKKDKENGLKPEVSKKDKENGLKPEDKLVSPSLFSSTTTSSASASSSTSASASASSKSLFWRLTRSSSCGSGYTRSLICNLSLLSRSNSTGSAPNRNPKPSSSHNHNKNSSSRSGGGANGNTKLSSSSSTSSTSSASSSLYYPYSTSSKKNYGSKNNGIRVNPILNVPPPYISRGTVNLFGFGSLFCNGKEKEKNKKKRSAMVN